MRKLAFCLLFARGCGIVLLMNFERRYWLRNCYKDKENKKDGNYFSGLPSPGAAAALCVMVFFAANCKIPIKYFAIILPVYAAVLGLLMVSKVRYIHAGRWLFSMWKNRIKFFIFVIMLAIIAIFRLNGLVFLVTAYIISGPLATIFARLKKEEQK